MIHLSKFKKYAPQYPAEMSENPVCTRYPRCIGCPYPQHGFICWHRNGECLRTDMERIAEKRKGKGE